MPIDGELGHLFIYLFIYLFVQEPLMQTPQSSSLSFSYRLTRDKSFWHLNKFNWLPVGVSKTAGLVT